MKKLVCLVITLLSLDLGASVLIDTRRILEGVPIVGDIVRNAQRLDVDKFHTHDSGVFYENTTSETFPIMNYTLTKGSLRGNLERLAKKFGWAVRWDLTIDYDVPLGFTITNKRMPEIFGEALMHLPIRTTFYTKNKMIVVLPMYDKRETDVGKKYSINPRV